MEVLWLVQRKVRRQITLFLRYNKWSESPHNHLYIFRLLVYSSIVQFQHQNNCIWWHFFSFILQARQRYNLGLHLYLVCLLHLSTLSRHTHECVLWDSEEDCSSWVFSAWKTPSLVLWPFPKVGTIIVPISLCALVVPPERRVVSADGMIPTRSTAEVESPAMSIAGFILLTKAFDVSLPQYKLA